MQKKYFYISKEYAKKNGIWIYDESETKIEDYKEKYSDDCFEYFSYSFPNTPWYDEEIDKIVEMPVYKKVELGIRILENGEYINESNELVYVSPPVDFIKPYWDFSEKIWKEMYTDEELIEHYKEESIEFFNDEIKAVQQIMFMKNMELLSPEDDVEILKDYLHSLNPYVAKTKPMIGMERPSILAKYRL